MKLFEPRSERWIQIQLQEIVKFEKIGSNNRPKSLTSTHSFPYATTKLASQYVLGKYTQNIVGSFVLAIFGRFYAIQTTDTTLSVDIIYGWHSNRSNKKLSIDKRIWAQAKYAMTKTWTRRYIGQFESADGRQTSSVTPNSNSLHRCASNTAVGDMDRGYVAFTKTFGRYRIVVTSSQWIINYGFDWPHSFGPPPAYYAKPCEIWIGDAIARTMWMNWWHALGAQS